MLAFNYGKLYYFIMSKKWTQLNEAEKQERGQQILRQCSREIKESLKKFGLAFRKIKNKSKRGKYETM